MGALEKVKAMLDNEGVQYEHLTHDPTFTAQETAAATHISGKELAKVVMIKADDELVMVVTPASKQVDLDAFKKTVGAKKVSLAKEEEFAPEFPECEAGAMSPLGPLYGLKVYEDETLAADEDIAFNAGTHKDVIRMTHKDFALLAKPEVGSFTKGAA